MTTTVPRGLPGARVRLRAMAPGAATAGLRDMADRQVMRVDINAEERKGAISSSASETLADAARAALATGVPLVVFVASSGPDMSEGLAALHGWGVAARTIADCSGVVPVLMAVTGPAVAGPALLIGLADHVVMTEDSYAFVSGPVMVAEFTGVHIGTDELGGAGAHARQSGAASLVVPDAEAAEAAIEELLGYLPANNDTEPPHRPTDDPVERRLDEVAALLPTQTTGSYDIRGVMELLVDDGEVLELRGRWAPNVVTAFGAIDGRPVGLVGNQPMAIAGTLDIPSSQKAARFVSFCDAFNLPIVTLVDTPGFYPGKDLEWRGMIRHGAQLVFAYARASVPRVGVILRKSYGGAYIVMDSKRMGNDICLAWPTAELAVMGAGQASAILMRRATPDEKATFEDDYSARLLNPYIAAERGYVDAVIDPAATRTAVANAIEMLSAKREVLVARKHDNTPL